jgi:hypothetical protein
MDVCPVATWEQFETLLEDMYGVREVWKGASRAAATNVSTLLFRGQGDSRWRLETTLERDAPHWARVLDYHEAAYACKYQIETFTDRVWELEDPSEFRRRLERAGRAHFQLLPLVGYEYLVYLRHHGFPSPLLDWSASPYIAAFFAFKQPPSSAGYVSIYAYLERVGEAKMAEEGVPAIDGCGPVVRSHRRHVLQQCEYTACTVYRDGEWRYASHEEVFASGPQGQDIIRKFELPTSERLKILSRLDKYNLNAFSLFGSEESLMHTVAVREILRKWV